ncbi:hypothetical protein GCM10027443_43430 [Pontibacter brevis]
MANKPSSIALRSIRDRLDKFLDSTLNNNVQVVLPKNLARSFLIEHTPPGIDEARWLSMAYYIVQTILLMSRDKRFKSHNRSLRGYVPLSSTILKGLGGAKYKVAVDHLIEIGVIERDGVFSKVRHENMGYRLCRQYWSQRFKYRTIPDAEVRKTIVQHRKQQLEIMKPRLRELAHVVRWLTDGKLRLDKEKALEYIEDYKVFWDFRMKKLHLQGESLENARIDAKHRFNWAACSIEQWESDTHLSVDDKGGRLYSPLTSILSPLRHFLTYDGKSLVSFDLKNSQPLHLVLLMRPEFWSSNSRDKWTLKKLNGELWKHLQQQGHMSPTSSLSPIILQKTTPLTDNESVVESHFARLVLTGKLYEFISEHFRGKYTSAEGVDRFDTRTKAKKQVLRLMYFNPLKFHSPSHDTFREFRQRFPLEAQVLQLLKSRDYRDLPVLLQKLEAQILLHEVCKEIYELDRNIPLFTVHDSIITTTDHAETVKGILLATYQNLLGAAPQLEHKELQPSIAYNELWDYSLGKLREEFSMPEPQAEFILAGMKFRMPNGKPTQPSVPQEFPLLQDVSVDVGSVDNPFGEPKRKLRK